ncbi:hypothetical protein KHA90_08030 [Flavobacterium psychroterrae]|uniref:DUF2621 domain-containing protein n=1 Tax=Flavobacterium psychroterrae TaxID=2133767 RepID=A0ABS5P9M7_9FLAO|nr:hypothetical protein [Flavobacterium psychroterrae]MBS7230969.1 hypothetical protein [Flavobacterium psychroterrae]
MLATISWSDYAVTVVILLFIWYTYLVFRFYSTKVKALFNGKTRIGFPKKKAMLNDLQDSLFSEFSEPFDTLQDAEELYEKLLQAIQESAEREISRIEFKNYIRCILEEYPYVKMSSLRIKINTLLVCECEKHAAFTLQYAEADHLWEDSI